MSDRPIDDQPNGSQGTPSGDEPAGEQPGQQGAAEQTTGQDMWWYAVNGKSYGPVSERELVALARAGHFKRDDFVYAAYIGSWVRADSVHGLFDVVGPQAGAPPVGPGGVQPPLESIPPYPIVYAPYAGFWIRFVAVFIDGLLLGVLYCAISFTTLGGLGPRMPMPGSGNSLPDIMPILFRMFTFNMANIIVGWLYFGFMESSAWQATLVKRAVGIMVTDMEGRRISFARASGRYFASLLSGLILNIGYIIGAFTERKQTLHDMIVNTVVVHGRPDEAVARR